MNKTQRYESLLVSAKTLMGTDDDWITRMANISSLLYHTLEHVNWAGFYRADGDMLLLGPFQGKPACTPIPFGKGVCGTCAAKKTVQCIENVHEFPGHIACDSASNSEIVMPIIEKDTLIGVLDIDSNAFHNFDETDIRYLTRLIDLMLIHDEYGNKK